MQEISERDAVSIPGSRKSPAEGHGNLLQYSCWRIQWTEEPGGLQFIRSQTVRDDWRDLACVQRVNKGRNLCSQSNVLIHREQWPAINHIPHSCGSMLRISQILIRMEFALIDFLWGMFSKNCLNQKQNCCVKWILMLLGYWLWD